MAGVALGYHGSGSSLTASVSNTSGQHVSLDDATAARVVADAAYTANLSVASNANNLSMSLAIQNELAQVDDSTLVKPQFAQPEVERLAVIAHTVQNGENIADIAREYGITAQTVRWANDLEGNEVDSGTELKILPVDGVLYTVGAEDTVEGIADSYNSNAQRIVIFNNLEITGLNPGAEIIVPAGELPAEERPGYQEPVAPTIPAPSTSTVIGSGSFSGASVGNRYAYGYCTWYVYERRAEMGRPVGSFWGNANTWAAAASSNGSAVNSTPQVGSILQTASGFGGYGHVAIVDEVRPDGSIRISEMNYAGWNVVSSRDIDAGAARGYLYIH